MCGNTCRAFWIVKYVHSLNCDDHFATKPDFGDNLSKTLLHFFLIIGQIIDIDVTLKLSPILSSYRQNYQYKQPKEDYWRVIIIANFDLSPTPILRKTCSNENEKVSYHFPASFKCQDTKKFRLCSTGVISKTG